VLCERLEFALRVVPAVELGADAGERAVPSGDLGVALDQLADGADELAEPALLAAQSHHMCPE
jgi:hypothetical protein